MTPNRLWIWLLAAAGGAVVAVMALTSGPGGDYPGPACHGCDYAGPPIDALVHGNLHRFFAVQPVMGSFSLLVRWPAALVAQLAAHGDVLWQYRLGAFVCLLGLLALGIALARRMESRGASGLAQAVTVGICTASPLAFAALHWGHPEEPLAASLCVGAVLLAGEGRARSAGLLLGLAFATKPWAWLAIGAAGACGAPRAPHDAGCGRRRRRPPDPADAARRPRPLHRRGALIRNGLGRRDALQRLVGLRSRAVRWRPAGRPRPPTRSRSRSPRWRTHL